MIFFLTGTGNSFYVAKRIAAATGDRCASITQAFDAGAPFSEERVGIVCPVYNHDLPPLVKRFLQTVTIDTPYLFLVLTYGNRAGGAQQIAREFLEAQGLSASYINTLLMVDNWLPGYDIAEECAMDKHTEEHLAEICADVVQRRTFLLPATDEELAIYQRGIEKYGAIFEDIDFLRGFLTITDACTHCGTCARVCPSRCIHIANDENGNVTVERLAESGLICTACLGCAHACPAYAINISMGEKNPSAHYLNEHVTLDELARANESRNGQS